MLVFISFLYICLRYIVVFLGITAVTLAHEGANFRNGEVQLPSSHHRKRGSSNTNCAGIHFFSISIRKVGIFRCCADTRAIFRGVHSVLCLFIFIYLHFVKFFWSRVQRNKPKSVKGWAECRPHIKMTLIEKMEALDPTTTKTPIAFYR